MKGKLLKDDEIPELSIVCIFFSVLSFWYGSCHRRPYPIDHLNFLLNLQIEICDRDKLLGRGIGFRGVIENDTRKRDTTHAQYLPNLDKVVSSVYNASSSKNTKLVVKVVSKFMGLFLIHAHIG